MIDFSFYLGLSMKSCAYCIPLLENKRIAFVLMSLRLTCRCISGTTEEVLTKEDRSMIYLQRKRLNCISVANLDAHKKNFISSSLFRRENPLFSGKLKYLIGTLRQSFPSRVFTLLFLFQPDFVRRTFPGVSSNVKQQ